jgi:hypothetical protein
MADDNQKIIDTFNNISLEELEYIVRYKSDEYNENAIKIAYECLIARGGHADDPNPVAKRKPKAKSENDNTEPVISAIKDWAGFELFLTVFGIIGIAYSIIVLANQQLPQGYSMPISTYIPSFAIIILLLFRLNYLWSVVKA